MGRQIEFMNLIIELFFLCKINSIVSLFFSFMDKLYFHFDSVHV